MRMFFDMDETVKVRFLNQTYEVKKYKLAEFLLGEGNEENKLDTTMEKIIFATYLPMLISIECVGGNPNRMILHPINAHIEVSDELAGFLVLPEHLVK